MRAADLLIGILLGLGATVFVVQEVAAAREVAGTLAPISGQVPEESMAFEHQGGRIYDFFVTHEAFLLLHVWVVWASVLVWRRGVRETGRLGVSLLGYTVVLLIVGHGVAAWLASEGASVGLLGLY
jgi:hypothetical protein